jgi:hypothetical protein
MELLQDHVQWEASVLLVLNLQVLLSDLKQLLIVNDSNAMLVAIRNL